MTMEYFSIIETVLFGEKWLQTDLLTLFSMSHTNPLMFGTSFKSEHFRTEHF